MVEQNNTPEPISRLESATVCFVLKGFLFNVIAGVAKLLGWAVDVDQAASFWADLIINGISAYYYLRAYFARLKAVSPIEPIPWKEEIKTLIKK